MKKLFARLHADFKAWKLKEAIALCKANGFLVHQFEQIGKDFYIITEAGTRIKLGRKP